MSDEMERSMGRVEGKLDALINSFNTHTELNEKRHSKIAERVGTVEKKVWWLTGIGAAIAFIGSKLTWH